ncbi:VPS10, partial [Symbiodinium sp. CCMP2456]
VWSWEVLPDISGLHRSACDQVPRHLLRDALAQLCGEEEEAAEERAAPSSSKKAAKAKAAKAVKATSASATSAMLPRHLNDKIEAIPLSRSSCRGESKPSFLASLDAVLNVMAETKEQAKPPLSQQAESLQLLHQHLVDAGGSSLDYGPMDRLLALRPLLLLKLQGAAASSGALAADRARSWWEWKEAAAAALLRLGSQERHCVQIYVSLCLRHLYEHEPGSAEGAAGYPAQAPPNPAPQPPVAPAWNRARAAPVSTDFPALPSNQLQPRPRQARA